MNKYWNNQLRSKGLAVFLLLCLVLFILAGLPPVSAQSTGTPTLKEKARQVSLIREYQKRLREIDQEITELTDGRAWLEQKTMELKAFNRPVPAQITRSIERKEARLNSLSEVKSIVESRLNTLLKASARDMEPGPEMIGPGSQVAGGTRTPRMESAGLERFVSGLEKKIKETGLEDWVTLTTDSGCCRVANQLPILFPTASAVVADEYKGFLKNLAELVREYDVKIAVDGYADEESINTKTYPSNFELGASRAANVVHFLMESGVKPSVFQISSSGRYRFEAKGMSPKKPLERRADIRIVFACAE